MADKKRLGILLFSTPYGSESTDTTIKYTKQLSDSDRLGGA